MPFFILKVFISMVETQFQAKVKIVRSDNVLELGSSVETSSFLASQGIIHQTSYPYIFQQNGVMERKHKHLLETARALLFQSGLPVFYWGNCVLSATYLINRFPSSVLSGKSPHEVLFKSPPSYTHLRAFCCLCYITTPKPLRDKFKPRAAANVFLGYPFGKKSYKVLNLETKKINTSRDVVFHESVFPDKSKGSSIFDFFPVSDNSIFPPSLVHVNIEDLTSGSTIPIGDATLLPIETSDTTTTPSISTSSPSFTSVSSPSSPHTSSKSTSSPSFVPSVTPIRKSSRPHVTSLYLQDFVCYCAHTSPFFTLTNCFSFPSHLCLSSLSPNNQHLVKSVSTIQEPVTFQQAMLNPAWQ